MKMYYAIALLLMSCGMTVLTGCGTTRFIENIQKMSVTEEELQAEGRANHLQLEESELIYKDVKLTGYLNRVGSRVVRAAVANGMNDKWRIQQ